MVDTLNVFRDICQPEALVAKKESRKSSMMTQSRSFSHSTNAVSVLSDPVKDREVIVVLNKIDIFEKKFRPGMHKFKELFPKYEGSCVFVCFLFSAYSNRNVGQLLVILNLWQVMVSMVP